MATGRGLVSAAAPYGADRLRGVRSQLLFTVKQRKFFEAAVTLSLGTAMPLPPW